VIEVLKRLRPADGARVYEAIRLANPGGLGSAGEEDVRRGPPSRPLREAMALAAGRDLVACQYAGGFGEVFSDGVPSLEADLAAGLPLEPAIVRCHLQFMARYPDSLVARKCGRAAAREAAARARAVLALGWPKPRADRALAQLDRWLRADGHRRNPGTSADLVGASLFLAIRNGIIPLPISKVHPWKSTGCG
jgi:triphosphoribosyl-dephospho-CoA synthase